MEQPQEDLKPLIIRWLTEWKNGAGKVGSKMEFVYRNALKSLHTFPGPIHSEKDCRQIKYFGDKLCQRVADAIRDYHKKNGIFTESNEDDDIFVEGTQVQEKTGPKGKSKSAKSTDSQNGAKRNRDYIPKPNSGGFAILIALTLAEKEGIEELSKNEVMERAQPYATESMSKPNNGSHFTAFNSMKTLISHGLVQSEQRRYAFYRLTDEGRRLGLKLLTYVEGPSSSTSTHPVACSALSTDSDSTEDTSPTSLSKTIERFELTPGTFDVVLLVDTRESAAGVEAEFKKTAIITELLKNGILAEMRALPVGDFTWIAREKNEKLPTTHRGNKELVLDIIIERKTADDLVASIVDGRFREQKHRLKKCGIRKPTYLVESLNRLTSADYGVPYRNLMQAITNSLVIDGFDIKCTKDNAETIQLLTIITKYLATTLGNKTLKSCTLEEALEDDRDDSVEDVKGPVRFVKESLPADHYISFSEFEQGSKKVINYTCSEMFIKQLLQIAGVSVGKAKAIVSSYPTVHHLLEAYDACLTEKEKEKLLSKIKNPNMQKGIGPTVSKKIYTYYSYDSR